MKKLLVLLVLVGLASAGGVWLYCHPMMLQSFYTQEEQPKVDTADLRYDTLLETVTGTGTVQPREALVISTDQMGRVVKLLRDVNEVVEEGEDLLQIDDTVQQQKLKQAMAIVATAKATLASAQSAVEEAKVKHDAATKNLSQAREQFNQNNLTQTFLNLREAETDLAARGIHTAQTIVDTAKARVKEAEQGLELANLAVSMTRVRVPFVDHTPIPGSAADSRNIGTIRAEGDAKRPKRKYTILERKVVLNQLVGPQLGGQLFLLTPSVSEVEVQVQIAESDVHKVIKDQIAYFTVSAFENHYFTGQVKEIRPTPIVLTGTTYYLALLSVPRKAAEDGPFRLQPGMTTASLDIVTREVPAAGSKTWLVPESALNFSLEREFWLPEVKDKPKEGEQKWVWVTEDAQEAHSAHPLLIKEVGITGKVLDPKTHELLPETYTEIKAWTEMPAGLQPGQQASFKLITGAQAGKGSKFKIPSLIKS